MRNVKESITEIIGHTPLLHTSRLNSLCGADAEILVKIEGMNPGGSAKDRLVFADYAPISITDSKCVFADITESINGGTQ